MKRHMSPFDIVKKAVSLIVVIAFLATDAVYAAPLYSEREAALAPSHTDAKDSYKDEVAAYRKLEKDERDARIGFFGGALIMTVLMTLMLLTPINVEAREAAKRPARKDKVAVKTSASKEKPAVSEALPEEKEEPSLTEIAMSYMNRGLTLVSDGFKEKQVAQFRQDAERTVEFGMQTYLEDPLYGLFQGFALPIEDVKRISSGYGMRLHPIKKVLQMHSGIDFSAHKWINLYSAYSGKVIEVKNDYDPDPTAMGSGYGNMVKIETEAYGIPMQFVYGHLSKAYVDSGETVEPSVMIGGVGTTGASTGPHLHFEVLINGQHIDPALIIDSKKLKEWGASDESVRKREELEGKFSRLFRMKAEGITIENAIQFLELYQEILETLGLNKEVGHMEKARKSLSALQRGLEERSTGKKETDPAKSLDDFLKYLSLIFGSVTLVGKRKREEEKLEAGIAELISKGLLTQKTVDTLVDKAVEGVEAWVELKGTVLEKLTFSAESVRAELGIHAAKIIADSVPPAKPAETNSDVVTSTMPEDRA